MSNRGTTGTWPQPLTIAAIAAVAIVAISSLTIAIGAMWGGWGWDMGPGHMRGMMSGGSNTSNTTVTIGGATESVAIRNFTFTPGNLQVPVGAEVTWTNDDSAPHTATARDESWDTGTLNKGESKTIAFDKAGDYTYYCRVHPNMVARIAVK